MTTAFVLSGGGGLGAVQVGMLRALTACGVVPDLVVGSSVGAINGAFFAGDPTPDGVEALDSVWRAIRQGDVFPMDPRAAVLGLLGRRDHLVSPAALERLLRTHLGYDRLEQAPIPIHVVATEVARGTEVVLSAGDSVQALLASAAIPGVFPPVAFGGRLLMDGGVVDNTPIGPAVGLGADVVYVLPTEYRREGLQPSRSVLGAAMRALSIMAEQRLLGDVDRYGKLVHVEVVPPPPIPVRSPIDFGGTAHLIDAAAETAVRWLERRPRAHPSQRVRVHHHDGQTTISVGRRTRRASSAGFDRRLGATDHPPAA